MQISDYGDRKGTVWQITQHRPVSVCIAADAEHNYEVQEQLNRAEPTKSV
ncbi:hypothetical protein HMPREF0168_1726 [Bifidobacterium dentium ATCC 27679]|uniref:Uncharacterized protein n=1 Tax=Bifidobacterium dentium ATCC 27679 TaxID=871562 RepID=E0Q9S8_9BIFI|nr:hypothetical protein BIFDEN_00604 [Bifidobacterium dentium ATCC 27678]EFM40703.1 hypothetical protein HMPREF0168_1726 [Bifidobacterium dentium ATCC 27679]